MKTKTKSVVYIVVVLAVVMGAVIFALSYIERRNAPILQGYMECRTYRASSKIAGRVDSLFVAEGDWVEEGELLYTISTPELSAKLRQVEALEAAAAAINREVDNGARREQIAAARAMWQRAEAGEVLARESFNRVNNLYNRGVVPRQQYDEALANLNAMEAASRAARAEYDLAVEGATREEREAVAARVREAQGAVDEVSAYISDARVYAPVSGRVSSIISEPGELVGAGYPVVSILDLETQWAVFNIKEDAMSNVCVGGCFSGYIPALRKSVEFEIYYIAAEADFAVWSATRERGGFDIRTFEIKARPVDDAEGLLPGMSVIADEF